MNFDLTELAATLAIGIFCFAGIAGLFFMFSRRTAGSILTAMSKVSQPVIAIIAGFCFVAGMIVEDVSNKFVDDDNKWLSKAVSESDDEIKAKVFFGLHYQHTLNHEPTSLSYLASQQGLLHRYGGVDGYALEQHIVRASAFGPSSPRPAEIDGKRIKDVAKLFYYNAKGSTYKEPSYYNELKRIQMRIDFSRSLIAVSAFLAILFVVALSLTLVKRPTIWVLRYIENSAKKRLSMRRRLRAKRIREWANRVPVRPLRTLVFGFLLFLTFFAARFAYSSEEKEFDKRAYGYYIYQKINSEPASLPTRMNNERTEKLSLSIADNGKSHPK